MTPLKYSEIADLARLKYFSLNEKGNLQLKDNLFSRILHVNKVIDFHTHLGWNYLLAKPIDLTVESETSHFFPEKGAPIDLSHYSAFDFSKEHRKKCSTETLRGAYSNRGYSASHTIPNILGEMARYRVEKSIVLAVDYHKFSKNSEHILNATKGNNKFIAFASIPPLAKNKEELLQDYIAKGAKGLKIHPAMQLTKPINEGYYEVYELCKKYNVPILFHTGYSPLTPRFLSRYTKAKDYKQVVKDFPNNTFIFGHGGGADTYLNLAEIARYNENVYLEIGGQSPNSLSVILDIMGSDRILYGSDWPYYPMGMQLAKVLIATQYRPILRRKVLYWNAKNLIERFKME